MGVGGCGCAWVCACVVCMTMCMHVCLHWCLKAEGQPLEYSQLGNSQYSLHCSLHCTMLGVPSPVAELSHQPTWEGGEGRGGEGRGGEGRGGKKGRGRECMEGRKGGEGNREREAEENDTYSYCYFYSINL